MVNNNGNITTTEYNGNYVYENGVLKQITHKEGYLEPKAGGGYQYVYRIADIWGNTRITFADDDANGIVTNAEIRREQNYYPFGLEHRGYNNNISGPKNNLKTYQGQEFTDDLNLNTHEWKFRVSDPTIGRFWQIDPLSEKYVYNSTYAFQENKLGMGVELEGLELAGFDLIPYIIQKVVTFKAKTSKARDQVSKGLGSRIKTLATGVESNPSNSSVGGLTVSQVQDISAIGSGLETINTEAVNTTKEVIRDGADASEATGDLLVFVAPATGPAAPVVVGVGAGLSAGGSLINISMDLIEGDIKSAAERAGIEVASAGLSTLVKNIPEIGKTTQQVLDSHIVFYEDVVLPKIEEKTIINNQSN